MLDSKSTINVSFRETSYLFQRPLVLFEFLASFGVLSLCSETLIIVELLDCAVDELLKVLGRSGGGRGLGLRRLSSVGACADSEGFSAAGLAASPNRVDIASPKVGP